MAAAGVDDGRPASPFTKMREAVTTGNTFMLQQLVTTYPYHIDGTQESAGQAPILIAALLGQTRAVQLLLNSGGNPNRRGRRHETALMLAAQRGHADVINALLVRGALATAVDGRGWTALHFAAFAGHATAVRSLLGPNVTTRGELLEMRSTRDETALALAAFGRKDECCRALLEAGSQPSLVNDASDRAYAMKLLQDISDNSITADPDSRTGKPGEVPHGRKSGSSRHCAPQVGASRPAAARARPSTAAREIADEPGQRSDSMTNTASPLSRPIMQFSGTPDEYERLITPQQSELTGLLSPRGAGPDGASAPGRSTPDLVAAPSPNEEAKGVAASIAVADVGAVGAGDTAVAGVAHVTAAAAAVSWDLHELAYKDIQLLHHRPTGLLFTSVPVNSFPHVVGVIGNRGTPRWLGEADLQQLEAATQVCGALAATVPVARLLLRDLNVISEPVLRLCVLLGLHEVSELRELVLLEPGSPSYDAAWGPAGLLANHIAQLRPLLRPDLALKMQSGEGGAASAAAGASGACGVAHGGVSRGAGGYRAGGNGGEGAHHSSMNESGWLWPSPSEIGPLEGAGGRWEEGGGGVEEWVLHAGPLPADLVGVALVQHLLQRYGLAKLMLQVAELKISSAADLPMLSAWGRDRRGAAGTMAVATAAGMAAWGASEALGAWESARLGRLLRDLPKLLEQHQKARERMEAEAAFGPALEAMQQQRRLEALARPSRGSLVTYEDISGSSNDVAAGGPARSGASANGSNGNNSINAGHGVTRVAVVLDVDGDFGGDRYVVRDLESDRILTLLGGHLQRIRASDAARYIRRPDYVPPATVGVPLTPFSAAKGLLVTRGSSWGRGPAYDVYGEGIVGELVGPEEGDVSSAEDPMAMDVDGDGGYSGRLGRWLVRWPDGRVYGYSVGQGEVFELSFLGLHWRSGAPVLDSHRGLLLPPGEVAVLPVCRSPMWAEEAHDGLPGSVGSALLDRTTASLTVDWLRDLHFPRAYSPDPACGGAYPLLHAIMAGQPVTVFTARPGARVEQAGAFPGGSALVGAHFYHKYYTCWNVSAPELGGQGTLLAPLRLEEGGHVVVWLVSWPASGRSEARVAADPARCELVFAPLADTPQARNRRQHEHWHHQGAEGRLVRLNPAQLALQPNASSGPLRPTGRDMVGVVLRDLGPGVHCGLLVRPLGGCTAFWYDEDVLLPFSAVEMARRLPPAAAAALATGNAAVPVMDCTAMPGMLVRRCYDDGATLKCSTKEQQIGMLVAQVAASRWLVRWPDGSSAVYHTGSGSKFQLSYVCEHPQAGAPLAMPCSLDSLALSETAVVPAFDCCLPLGDGQRLGNGDTFMVGGSAMQVDEQDKIRLLAVERMPVTVGSAAKQIRYYAGGMFRLFELAHAAVPGEPVTVFTAKQGLRVVLHPPEMSRRGGGGRAATARAGGAKPQYGTLTRPVRLGSMGMTNGGPNKATGVGGIFNPATAALLAPSRRPASASRIRRPESARSSGISSGFGTEASLYSMSAVDLAAADLGNSGGTYDVDRSTVWWEVAWDAGTVSAYVIGVSPAVTALRVAKQKGFQLPAPVSPRGACPQDRHLRIHDPVLHRPIKGLQILDDHVLSLATHLDTAVCALNATCHRLAALWLAAAECEPSAPYRAIVQRVPMHGDTILLDVGSGSLSRASGIGGKEDRPTGHVGSELAQELLEMCQGADEEVAAAAAELQAALRGAPHLDLEAQRAAETAALEHRWRGDLAVGSTAATEDGSVASGTAAAAAAAVLYGNASAIDHYQGRWILTGSSFEDAAVDAIVGLKVVLVPMANGGGGGEDEPSLPQLAVTGPCSKIVAAAVVRFNRALESAQERLMDAASLKLHDVKMRKMRLAADLQKLQGKPDNEEKADLQRELAAVQKEISTLGSLRYHVTVLPRAPGAVMPLSHLLLSPRRQSYDTDPLLVQEMLETFHAFSLGLVVASPGGNAGGGGGGVPLGPLAVAALDLIPEVRLAAIRAHEAMNAYTTAQATEWRRQIVEMYGNDGSCCRPSMTVTGQGSIGGVVGGAISTVGGVSVGWSRCVEAASEAASEVISSVVGAGCGSGVGSGGGPQDTTRRGVWNGLMLSTSSPPMVVVQGGVSVGDIEGLVEPSEEATSLTPSELAARLNDALLQLWCGAGRANGCGGSAQVADTVVKIYRCMHAEVVKAIEDYGREFQAAEEAAKKAHQDAAAAAAGAQESKAKEQAQAQQQEDKDQDETPQGGSPQQSGAAGGQEGLEASAGAASEAAAEPAAAAAAAPSVTFNDSVTGGGVGRASRSNSGLQKGPVAEIVFRPVFVQSGRDPLQNQSQVHFHVAVLLKEPGHRAVQAPPEVDAVLMRSDIRALMEPLEQLLEVINNCLANAHRALRNMAAEAELLAPLLGEPAGTALLRGWRDGPMGLQAVRSRVGAHAEDLLRANLRQVSRHSTILEAYRALVGMLVAGLQEAASRLSELLEPVAVPYHTQRVEKERAAVAAAETEAAKLQELAARQAEKPAPPSALLTPSAPSAAKKAGSSPRHAARSHRSTSSTIGAYLASTSSAPVPAAEVGIPAQPTAVSGGAAGEKGENPAEQVDVVPEANPNIHGERAGAEDCAINGGGSGNEVPPEPEAEDSPQRLLDTVKLVVELEDVIAVPDKDEKDPAAEEEASGQFDVDDVDGLEGSVLGDLEVGGGEANDNMEDLHFMVNEPDARLKSLGVPLLVPHNDDESEDEDEVDIEIEHDEDDGGSKSAPKSPAVASTTGTQRSGTGSNYVGGAEDDLTRGKSPGGGGSSVVTGSSPKKLTRGSKTGGSSYQATELDDEVDDEGDLDDYAHWGTLGKDR